MQAQPFQLQRQVLGALPIFDPVIERIGLLPCLTQALGQARYAEAILLLLKNILVERQALYAIRQWAAPYDPRSEEHTSELQSRLHLVCRLLLEKKKHT